MARTHARVQATLWQDEDWRALSGAAQRVYLLLISQPQINHCGVLPLVPRRWARLAGDTTLDDVLDALGELEAARFVVGDEETEEILIRTFVKHDRIDKQPQLAASAMRQFEEVQSARIKVSLFDENTEFFASFAPLVEPLRSGVVEGVAEPLTEGLRGRGRIRGRGDLEVSRDSSPPTNHRDVAAEDDPEPSAVTFPVAGTEEVLRSV